ncbi:MAG: HEAT repeat domain-containing protein, partial [Candidatus Omnitrophica bacterium]|nr:HEAT repeat domain-containing protein [Candidatus Omnitrophota bacterium]
TGGKVVSEKIVYDNASELNRQPVITEESIKNMHDPFAIPEWVKRSGQEGIYTVKKGDTLWDIAEDKLGDSYLWTRIAENWNKENPDRQIKVDRISKDLIIAYIYPGQKLPVFVPAADKAVPAEEIPAKVPAKGQEPETGKEAVETKTDSGAGVSAEATEIEKDDPESTVDRQERESEKPAEEVTDPIRGPPEVKLINYRVLVDGKPGYGLTIDADTFTASDIPYLLGNTARTYYPLPVDFIEELTQKSSLRFLVISIPLNKSAYDELNNYWGKEVPSSDKRITIKDNNYIPYIKEVLKAAEDKLEVAFEFGNEYNLHWKDWFGSQAELIDWYKTLQKHATNVDDKVGKDVIVATANGELPSLKQLKAASEVDLWGLNVYRQASTAGIADEWIYLCEQAGLSRPIYLSEAGRNSYQSQKAQAEGVSRIWDKVKQRGLTVTFMSFEDNMRKGGDPYKQEHDEDYWGWRSQDGQAKAVYELMAKEWKQNLQPAKVSEDSSLKHESEKVDLLSRKRVEEEEKFDTRLKKAVNGINSQVDKIKERLTEVRSDLAEIKARRQQAKAEEKTNPEENINSINTNVKKIEKDYQQLKASIEKSLDNSKIKNKDEIISVYLTLSEEIVSVLGEVAELGGLSLGAAFGGRAGRIADLGTATYGIVDSSISVTPLAYAVALDALVDIIQMPTTSYFKRSGGIIIPDKELAGNGLFGILNAGKYEDGKGFGLEVNLGVAKLRLGARKGLDIDISLFGDNLPVVGTDYGKYVFFPYLNEDNQLEIKDDAGSLDPKLPSDGINEFLKHLAGRHMAFKDYNGVVVFSPRQKLAYSEAVLNTNPDYLYAVQRDGHYQIIWRIDSKDQEAEILSVAKMYYSAADYQAENFEFETETFLRDIKAWQKNNTISYIPGMVNLADAAAMIECLNNYGGEINPRTHHVEKIYKSPFEAALTVKKEVPLSRDNSFALDDKGNLIQSSKPADINPVTGNIVIPGRLSAYIDQFRSQGEFGEKTKEINGEEVTLNVPYVRLITPYGTIPLSAKQLNQLEVATYQVKAGDNIAYKFTNGMEDKIIPGTSITKVLIEVDGVEEETIAILDYPEPKDKENIYGWIVEEDDSINSVKKPQGFTHKVSKEVIFSAKNYESSVDYSLEREKQAKEKEEIKENPLKAKILSAALSTGNHDYEKGLPLGNSGRWVKVMYPMVETWEVGDNQEQHINWDSFGLSVGPVISLGQDLDKEVLYQSGKREGKVKPIEASQVKIKIDQFASLKTPVQLFEGEYNQPSRLKPVESLPNKFKAKYLEMADGRLFIPGPKAEELYEEALANYGLAITKDQLPRLLREEDLSEIKRVGQLTSHQFKKTPIKERKDKMYLGGGEIFADTLILLSEDNQGKFAVVEMGIKALKARRGNLENWGVVYDEKNTSVSEVSLKAAIKEGRFYTKDTEEDKKAFLIKSKETNEFYPYEPGIKAYRYMNSLSQSHFTVPEKIDNGLTQARYLTEEELVGQIENGSLELTVDGRSKGSYIIYINGNKDNKLTYPLSILDRDIAFYQGNLYFSQASGLNTKEEGDRVAAFIQKPDFKNNYLITPITDSKEGRDYLREKVEAVQAKQGNNWLWYEDNDSPGVYNQGIDEILKLNASASDRTSQQAEDYLFKGYRPLYQTIDKDSKKPIKLNYAGKTLIAQQYRDYLLLVRADGEMRKDKVVERTWQGNQGLIEAMRDLDNTLGQEVGETSKSEINSEVQKPVLSAYTELVKGDYDKAISLVDELLKINPGNSQFYYIRGIANLALNNHKESIADLERVLTLPVTPYLENTIETILPILKQLSTISATTSKSTEDMQRQVTAFIFNSGVNTDFIEGQIRGDLEEDLTHGSLVARVFRNNSPDTEIVSISVEENSQKFDYKLSQGLLRALLYVRQHPEIRAGVVNFSAGNNTDDLLQQVAIRELYERGIIVVASVGNRNEDTLTYPAAFDEVVAVAALDRNSRKAEYSNYGSYVDVSAQGAIQGIYNDYYVKAEGTSVAAPYVASLLTQMLQTNPKLSAQGAVKIIKETAELISDEYFQKGLLGKGKINPEGALRKAREYNKTATEKPVEKPIIDEATIIQKTENFLNTQKSQINRNFARNKLEKHQFNKIKIYELFKNLSDKERENRKNIEEAITKKRQLAISLLNEALKNEDKRVRMGAVYMFTQMLSINEKIDLLPKTIWDDGVEAIFKTDDEVARGLIEAALQVMKHDHNNAWLLKECFLTKIKKERLPTIVEKFNQPNKDLLSLLYMTLQPRNRFYSTDGGFKHAIVEHDIERHLSALFDNPEIIDALANFEKLNPKSLKQFAMFIKEISNTKAGEYVPTYAQEDSEMLMEDIRLIELTRRSTVLKLLIQEGDFKVPEATFAIFRWSHSPTVKINLPPMVWSTSDVPNLRKLLNSKYEYYRKAARKALKQIEEQNRQLENIGQILKRIESRNFNDRYRALHMLSLKNKLPNECIPYLIKILDETNWWIQELAVQNLTKIGKPTINSLVENLQDTKRDTRRYVVEALDILGWKPRTQKENISYLIAKEDWRAVTKIGQPAVKPLIRILKHLKYFTGMHTVLPKDGEIYYPVSKTLIWIGRSSVEPLIETLNDEHEIARAFAATLLGKLNDIRAVEPLIQALKDEQLIVRREATEALGKLRDTRAVEPLMQALEDLSTRVGAAEALGEIGDERAVEPLIRALEDEDAPVCEFAAEALGKIKNKRAVDPLIKVLKNAKGSSLREKAAKALGRLEDKSAVESLIQALKYRKSYALRAAAAESLSRLKDPRALEPLIKTLEDAKENGRRMYGHDGLLTKVIESLGELGDRRAIKPLLKILKEDTRFYARDSARNAINMIEREQIKQKTDSQNKGVQKIDSHFQAFIITNNYKQAYENYARFSQQAQELLEKGNINEANHVQQKAVEWFIAAYTLNLSKISNLKQQLSEKRQKIERSGLNTQGKEFLQIKIKSLQEEIKDLSNVNQNLKEEFFKENNELYTTILDKANRNGQVDKMEAIKDILDALKDFKTLLEILGDATTIWISNNSFKNENILELLSREVNKGGSLMRLTANGAASEFYYPAENIEDSHVLVFKRDSPSERYRLSKEGKRELVGYSIDIEGVKEIRGLSGELLKRIKVAKHTRDREGNDIEKYVGYDAWGKVVMEASLDSRGKVVNIIVNLDEDGDVLGEEILNNLNIDNPSQIEVSRIYNDFNKEDGEYTYHLTKLQGYAVSEDKKIKIADGNIKDFRLVEQIDLKGELVKTFGMDEYGREIR